MDDDSIPFAYLEYVEFKPGEPIEADWLLVFDRKAELTDRHDVDALSTEWEPVVVTRRGGVTLGGLFRRRAGSEAASE